MVIADWEILVFFFPLCCHRKCGLAFLHHRVDKHDWLLSERIGEGK